MSRTYIHGLTGQSLYGGNYYIKDGQIQSGSAAPSSSNGGGNSSANSALQLSYNLGSGVADAMNYAHAQASQESRNLAAGMAGIAGTSPSDYGDMIREILANGEQNTAKSQEFAREQMKFQRESDQLAMAWSAKEADKNRAWQERLADSAHQREVKDLIEAGLNPILSANQGAYTGSGATGQGFSSNGAMGQVDTSMNGAIGQLYSTMLNTASQAAITKMYTDASRYQADMAYSASKAQTEASIYNNNNSIEANKAINALNRDSAIRQAEIHAGATLGAAGMSAGAMRYSAEQAANAAMYGADQTYNYNKYRTDKEFEQRTEHSMMSDPVGYVQGTLGRIFPKNWMPGVSSYNYDWSTSNQGAS